MSCKHLKLIDLPTFSLLFRALAAVIPGALNRVRHDTSLVLSRGCYRRVTMQRDSSRVLRSAPTSTTTRSRATRTLLKAHDVRGCAPRGRGGPARASFRCESVTELLGGGLHSGWAGPPVSSVGDHSPRDLSVFVGIRGRGARPGAPENPLMPIDPKPRPRLADSPPESLSSRSPASVGQATGSGGPTRSRSVCP